MGPVVLHCRRRSVAWSTVARYPHRFHRQVFIVTRSQAKTQVDRFSRAATAGTLLVGRRRRREKTSRGIPGGTLRTLPASPETWISQLTDHKETNALPPALAAPRERFVTDGETAIAYYADASADGIPLVLIHSVNAAPSAIEMKPLFDHYRSVRPVFAPELPGFGASDRRDLEYTPSLFAESLCEFVDATAGQGADVVALSLSSEFAARAARLAPHLFRSLTLVSPTGFGNRKPPREQTSNRIVRLLRNPVLGPGLFGLLTSKPSIRYFLNLSFVERAPDELVDYAWRTAHRSGARFAPTAFVSGRLFAADAVAELYEPLALPVLVLYDRDPNISFERLPALIDSRSNWRAERISPSRGLPHFENLDAVTGALDSFWAEIDRD